MPKAVTEITSGNQFSRSGGQGTGNDSHTRVFRVVLSSPTETFNPETNPDIAVKVGDKHPFNDVYCTGYSVRYEGDSRLVMLVTLEYGAAAGSGGAGGPDPNSQPPEVRPANWTTSTSLIEQPVYSWWKRTGQNAWAAETPATNPAGDIYEAVTQLTPIVNISITQPEATDPVGKCLWAGYINSEEITLGTLLMRKHTVMFRGVSSTPVVENWGGLTLRRWQATYEFLYKPNVTNISFGGAPQSVMLGWDIAVPQTGYNVITVDPTGAGSDVDIYGQPLRLKLGKVDEPFGLPFLPDNLAAGRKARAMVLIPEVEGGGKSLAPSASPIPLNDDGTPRAETADPKVLVYGYQVQPEVNLTQTLGVRLL